MTTLPGNGSQPTILPSRESRISVFKKLHAERLYQQGKFPVDDSYIQRPVQMTENSDPILERAHEVGTWLAFMQAYLSDALAECVYGGPNAVRATLDEVRKVTALGVACLEQHGCPDRESEDSFPKMIQSEIAASMAKAQEAEFNKTSAPDCGSDPKIALRTKLMEEMAKAGITMYHLGWFLGPKPLTELSIRELQRGIIYCQEHQSSQEQRKARDEKITSGIVGLADNLLSINPGDPELAPLHRMARELKLKAEAAKLAEAAP